MKRLREDPIVDPISVDPIARLREFEESVRKRNLRRNPFFGAPSYPNRVNTVFSGKQMCYYAMENNERVLKTMPVEKMQQSHVELIKTGKNGIWVVPRNDPLHIYFTFKFPNERVLDEYFYVCSDTKYKINMMHHDNLLPKGEEIVCGGEFAFKTYTKTLFLDNHSGHYAPRPECLLIANQLFQDLGFESIKLVFYGK